MNQKRTKFSAKEITQKTECFSSNKKEINIYYKPKNMLSNNFGVFMDMISLVK